MTPREVMMSLCDSCRHLEVWPKVFPGSRFLCGARFEEMPKEFGKYGRDTTKGTPKVKRCSHFEEGRHYSRRADK